MNAQPSIIPGARALTRQDLEAHWMPFSANRNFKNQPRLLSHAKGVHYWTPEGRQILDGVAGLWCVNAGHGRTEISQAVARSLEQMDFAPPFQMGHPMAFELANKIVEIAPEGMDHVFFVNSGSEAVESALKIALQYHRLRGEGTRTRFIARERAYHGVNFGGMSLGGMPPNRKAWSPVMTPGVDHLPHTHDLARNAFSRGQPEHGANLALELERLVTLHDASNIAAVIVEPVAGSTGVLVPPKGYLQKLREICTKHGILLIFDEVITGFGRVGAPFGAQQFEVTPDIITMAKGLTNAHPSMVMGQAYSGGAAVDENNTLGKQVGDIKTLLFSVADTGGGLGGTNGGVGEVLAYSNDNGKTYNVLKDRLIVSHNGRDPKIFWYEPEKKWCVVVYNGGHAAPPPVAWIGKMEFYSSKDLKTWTKDSETEELFHECPEFVELPVDGDPKNKKWLLFDGCLRYQVGTFDGKTFKPESAEPRYSMGGEIKAGQCFSNAPGGRAICMVWARTFQKDKNTPFNQGFTLPVELTLKTTADGIRCYANPVKELEALRGAEILSVANQKLNTGDNALKFKQPAE